MDIELLRLAIAGSVDDGKSTLLGRLLYDAKALFDDQLEALEASFDLAQMTDGLRAEREQGITIDVAYRYFATPIRRFVIADCPGHIQYTRNAVTGMSTASALLLLVDARQGIVEQTRRHAYLASLLEVPRVVFVVNKMDLVAFDRQVFMRIAADLSTLAARLELANVDVLPASALNGDNVTTPSNDLAWFAGPTVLEHLEQVPTEDRHRLRPARFFVQCGIRPPEGGRIYAGQLASGRLTVGEEVLVLPGAVKTRIAGIDTHDEDLVVAEAPRSIRIRLAGEVDAARGDMIVAATQRPRRVDSFVAGVSWMSERPLVEREMVQLKHGARRIRARVERIEDKLDLKTLERHSRDDSLALNDIGRVLFRVAEPIDLDRHRDNPPGGRMIVIDPSTNDTVGAAFVDRFD